MKKLALIRIAVSAVVFGLLAAGMGSGLSAAEVTPEMASRAVKNWRATRDAFGCKFGSRVASARRCESGDAKFNVVKLDGGGFVVTSADTAVRPILFFCDGEDLDEDPRNPLFALLKQDMRRAAAKRQGGATLASVKPGTTVDGSGNQDAYERQWEALLVESNAATLSAIKTPSDIRVNALVQSKWNQSTVSGSGWFSTSKNVYNYYTPNNYVCGCVATAMAQIMRYHQFPTASMAQFSNPNCTVSGTDTELTSMGGTYDWANMPLSPGSSIKTAQQQAIGKLCYDAGVAVSMGYSKSGSGSWVYVVPHALVNRFGYRGAMAALWSDGNSSVSLERTRRTMITNFDAGLPIEIGITGDGGHAIVADGYGYSNGSFCCHLNFGWAGSDDGWYIPPDLGDYNLIDEIAYNIFPTQDPTCAIVSGRVLSSTGSAASGVTVTAVKSGATSATATTNSKGIFALFVKPGTYSVKAESGSYTVTTTATPTALKSLSIVLENNNPTGSYWTGNRNAEICNVHVGDMQLSLPTVAKIGSAEYTSLVAACNAAQSGDTILLVRSVTEDPTLKTACTLDFQGYTVNGTVYCTYNTAGGVVTLKNGTITGKTDSFDGQSGTSATFPNGRVVFENMTVTGTIWSDSHPLAFTSGTYTGAVRAGSQNCTIDGGDFVSLQKDGAGVFVVIGGHFAENFSAISQISDCLHWVNDGTAGYPWVVKELVRAKIGSTTYPSFAEACAAVKKGETVVLMEDNAESPVTVGPNCTVDFGGHTFAGEFVCTNTATVTLMNGRLTGNVVGLPEGTTGANGTINFASLTTTGLVTLNRHAAVFRDGTYGTVASGAGQLVVTNGCTMALIQGSGSGQVRVYPNTAVTRVVQEGSGTVFLVGGEVGTIEGKNATLNGGNVGSVTVTGTLTGNGGNANTVNAGTVRLSAGVFGAVTDNGSGVCTVTNVVVASYVHAGTGRMMVTGGKFGSFTVQSTEESKSVTIRGGRFGSKPVGEYVLDAGLHWAYDGSDQDYPWFLTDAVAKLGNTVYPSLDAACAVAANGDTVLLLGDDDEERALVRKSGFIDLGNCTFGGELACTNASSSVVVVGNGTVSGSVVNIGKGIVCVTNNCTVALLRGESTGQLRISPGCVVERVVQVGTGSVMVDGGAIGSIEGKTVQLHAGNVGVIDASGTVTGNGGDATSVTAGCVRLSAGDFGTVTAVGTAVSSMTNVVVGAYVHAGTGRLVVTGGWFGSLTAQAGCGQVTVKGGFFKSQPTGAITIPQGWRWECVEGEEYPWRLTDAPPPGPTPEEAMAKLDSGEVKMSIRQEPQGFVLRVEYAESGLWYGFWGADNLTDVFQIMPETFRQGNGETLEIVAPPRQGPKGFYKIGIRREKP